MLSLRSFALTHPSLACRSHLALYTFSLARAPFSTTSTWQHNTSAQSTVAQNVQRTEQTTTSPAKSSKGTKTRPAKTQEDPSYEEQVEHLDRIHALEHSVHYDIWARPVNLFDVHIPTQWSTRKNASFGDHIKAVFANTQNALRNAVSLFRMAREQSFFGIRVKRAWSIQLFKTQSTPWLQPLLQNALDTYKQVNQLVAAGDVKALKKLTISDYQELLLERVRQRNPSHVYVWTYHGESKPSKVVSIRAEEVNLSSSPLTYGNRLLVQACVKFETMQSLEVYTKRGERIAGDGTPKLVSEYLVFQKRMWYDSPWVIRDQLYEGLESRYTTNP